MHPLNPKASKMDIEIKGGLSMNHDTTQSDWRTVASCLASQNYISIVKGLVHHFTSIKDEEILIKSMMILWMMTL